MTAIRKSRREWFGGLVYSENPGFTAFVDDRRADALDIPRCEGLRPGLFSAPLDVHMSITTRCNLRCRGCYTLNSSSPAMDMPLELAKTIIDRLAAMDVFTIAIGGGEPFLHPHVFQIAEYARQNRVVPNVTTNGLLMDAETSRKCSVFGSVHVSCHQRADLSQLADAVRALKKSGVDVGLNVLVSAATYEELPDIWQWCAAHGISRLLLLKFKLTAANQECRDLLLSAAQERAVIPLMRKLSRRHSVMPMLDCSLFPSLAFSRPRKKDIEFFDVNGCVGGNAICAVTTDGYFKPCSFCQTACGDARMLNRETWKDNEALAKFREYRAYPRCSTCDYEECCNGGCRIAATEWCQEW